MTFAEDNEIMWNKTECSLYIHTYIYTKIGIRVGLLLKETKKQNHTIISLLFLSSYLFTVILNTLIFECLFLVILFYTGIYIGYFIIILILYLNRN